MNWKQTAQNLFGNVYIEPGVWNIPLTSIILHGLIGYCIWTGVVHWAVGAGVYAYLNDIRIVYATKKARTIIEAQRLAYMRAYNQEMIDQGRLIAPDGKEYL